ncbi:Xylem serine proteinase 1 [Acorus calamus]|uniref:Xylem serine proteinase 1 n=1 Tax=Acorus calamus TaxID=4465 RepID=A0AAV9DI38_ACOCL|nr:Xylem serine proteinase 1 [Acorus calamus]
MEKASMHLLLSFSQRKQRESQIIGAKSFNQMKFYSPDDDPSPVDTDGHGTHTSSTILGGLVGRANIYGLADGTARGAVPSARVAVYKVCWIQGCADHDILSGFDEAIADGVDVISVSLGGLTTGYFEDAISIGAFHAVARGIVVSCSAGNDGPTPGLLENVGPWVITVAATGIDRQFKTRVRLGNGEDITGTGSRQDWIWYNVSDGDRFAHLDLGFKFHGLTERVDGVLGRTYRRDYVSKVKMGVAMPVVGGEKEFEVTGAFATDCRVSQYGSGGGAAAEVVGGNGGEYGRVECKSGGNGRGVVCKR